jgi:hypothetical protein
MKRLGLFLLAVVMVASLAECSSGPDESHDWVIPSTSITGTWTESKEMYGNWTTTLILTQEDSSISGVHDETYQSRQLSCDVSGTYDARSGVMELLIPKSFFSDYDGWATFRFKSDDEMCQVHHNNSDVILFCYSRVADP